MRCLHISAVLTVIEKGVLACTVAVLFACTAVVARAQEKNPQRGFQPGNSYALSDIETINTTNGNPDAKDELGFDESAFE